MQRDSYKTHTKSFLQRNSYETHQAASSHGAILEFLAAKAMIGSHRAINAEIVNRTNSFGCYQFDSIKCSYQIVSD